jgi:hypothetical protein
MYVAISEIKNISVVFPPVNKIALILIQIFAQSAYHGYERDFAGIVIAWRAKRRVEAGKG